MRELFRIEDEKLQPGSARTFSWDVHGHRRGGFIARHATGVCAFVNRCPHWNLPLNDRDGRIYDPATRSLRCSVHGALFDPDSGVCTSGPCEGGSLPPLRVSREGSAWVVRESLLGDGRLELSQRAEIAVVADSDRESE